MSGSVSPADVARGTGFLLPLAAVAVALAAVDIYVVVLALPDMMASTGVPIDQVHRATPIISSFLVGCVATTRLAGRLTDLRGRLPVLTLALVVLSVGTVLTVLAHDVNSMAVGRFLQGSGAGALAPVSRALVADLRLTGRRTDPPDMVAGAQTVALVGGPPLAAIVLTFTDWRAMFALLLAVALVLTASLRLLTVPASAIEQPGATAPAHPGRGGFPDAVGAALGLLALLAAVLVILRPGAIVRDLFWGQMFLPFLSDGRWLSPLGAVAMAASGLFVVRLLRARRPLVDVRPWLPAALAADVTASALVVVTLGGVVLACTTADPTTRHLPVDGQWYLVGAALGAICLVVHLRRSPGSRVPRETFRTLPARAAVLVSLLLGAALIAALVHIPLLARTSGHSDSPLTGALVLLQFLVALPLGSWIARPLNRWWGPGRCTALGMAVTAGCFASMWQWQDPALEHWSSSVTLVLCGFGFGIAVASLDAVVLASTQDSLQGSSSTWMALARMVGMVLGSATLVGTAQHSTVFAGAAVLSLTSAALSIVMFRTTPPARTSRSAGLV